MAMLPDTAAQKPVIYRPPATTKPKDKPVVYSSQPKKKEEKKQRKNEPEEIAPMQPAGPGIVQAPVIYSKRMTLLPQQLAPGIKTTNVPGAISPTFSSSTQTPRWYGLQSIKAPGYLDPARVSSVQRSNAAMIGTEELPAGWHPPMALPEQKSAEEVKQTQQGITGYYSFYPGGEQYATRIGPDGKQQWQVKGMSGMLYWVNFDPTKGTGGKMTYLPTPSLPKTGQLAQGDGRRLMNKLTPKRGGGGGGWGGYGSGYAYNNNQDWYSNLINWRI